MPKGVLLFLRHALKLSTKCRQLETQNQNCILILQGYNVKGDSRPPSQIPHAYRNSAKRVCLQAEGVLLFCGTPSVYLLFSLSSALSSCLSFLSFFCFSGRVLPNM